MIKRLVDDETYETLGWIEAEPVCGEDFCDTCGDCLHCFGGDPCYDGGEERLSHNWVEYVKKGETEND